SLKSIAGTIGAVELEKLAVVLEKAFSLAGPDEQIQPILTLLGAELDRLVMDLTSHLPVIPKSCDNTHSDTTDVAVVTQILKVLQGYINSSDGKSERYLDDYQKELAGLPAKELDQLKTCLNNFDFVASGAALRNLSARNGIILSSEERGNYQS
ncbi:MAG: hypothetical protein WCI45_12645, partial [Desulfuromonadales bacterium]